MLWQKHSVCHDWFYLCIPAEYLGMYDTVDETYRYINTSICVPEDGLVIPFLRSILKLNLIMRSLIYF